MKKFILLGTCVLSIACTPVGAQENGFLSSPTTHHETRGKIQVSGTGHAMQTPDQASVSAGVVTEGKTAGDAMRANALFMNTAFDALKKAGIKDKDIMTSQMSLQPKYNYNNRENNKVPRIIGYEVRNTVSATSNNLDSVGPMLDALVSSGVNTINGVNFSIKDEKSALAKARTDAVKAAREKAENIARAAGIKLDKIIYISETNGFQPSLQPMMMVRGMAADALESTPVAAGEQTLSVTVNITYAIDQ